MSVNKVNQSTGELSPIAGGTLYADAPVGSIQAYGGSSAPWGWLLCQGQAISRTTYAELFNVIGTSFGEGDGSTTFNIPDMRESVPKGAGLSGKSSTHYDADGVALGEFIEDRVQEHTHGLGEIVSAGNGPGSSEQYTQIQAASIYADNYNTLSNSGRKGATTEVKSVGVNYIIKATTISLPSDFETAVDEKIEDAASNFVKSLAYNTTYTATANGQTMVVSHIQDTVPSGHTYLGSITSVHQGNTTLVGDFFNYNELNGGGAVCTFKGISGSTTFIFRTVVFYI